MSIYAAGSADVLMPSVERDMHEIRRFETGMYILETITILRGVGSRRRHH